MQVSAIKTLALAAKMPSPEWLGSYMQRREFIALVGGATAASAGWPLDAGAQAPAKVPRIGCIAPSGAAATKRILEAFRKGLQERGYVESQSIVLDVRYAEGSSERIPELVTELVGLKMDVLVTGNSVSSPRVSSLSRA